MRGILVIMCLRRIKLNVDLSRERIVYRGIMEKGLADDRSEKSPEQLYKRSYELDDFIYATSHNLRGPLATLKGLINLLALPKDNEVDENFIIKQMKIFADRLDDRLHKLMYFAESDKALEFSTERVPLKYIVEKLRVDENALHGAQQIKFTEHFSESLTVIENGQLILTLLQNVKSFFQSKGTEDWELIFRSNEEFNEFELIANGITISPATLKKIDVVNFGYTEILSDPDFTDLYAAKKITIKLKGTMQISLLSQKASAHILVPRIKIT
jgi:signal transduction histidine kinase